MHVDHTLVETTADLIKLASDKEEQLQGLSVQNYNECKLADHTDLMQCNLQTSVKGKRMWQCTQKPWFLWQNLRLSKLRIALRVLETTPTL